MWDARHAPRRRAPSADYTSCIRSRTPSTGVFLPVSVRLHRTILLSATVVLMIWLGLGAPPGRVLGAPRTPQHAAKARRSPIHPLPVASESPPPPTAVGVTTARTAMVPNGRLTSVWGDPRDGGRLHRGEDLAAPAGSPIYAPVQLTIESNGWSTLGGWKVTGRDVLGRRWYFGHLQHQSSLPVDSTVHEGQVIGSIGSTGKATGPHLHYQVSWPHGDWGNPVEVLHAYPDARVTPSHSPPACSSAVPCPL